VKNGTICARMEEAHRRLSAIQKEFEDCLTIEQDYAIVEQSETGDHERELLEDFRVYEQARYFYGE